MTDCAFENENASAWGTGPFLLQAQVRAGRAECRRPSRDPWTVWCESKESASRQGGRKMEGVYHGHEGCDREERFKLRMESLTQFNVRRVRRQIATSTFLTAACNRGGSRVGALVSSEAGKLEDSQTILSERKEPIHRLRMNAAAFPHADARLQCLDASQVLAAGVDSTLLHRFLSMPAIKLSVKSSEGHRSIMYYALPSTPLGILSTRLEGSCALSETLRWRILALLAGRAVSIHIVRTG